MSISLIEFEPLRFVILDCPGDATLESQYLDKLLDYGVTDVVRIRDEPLPAAASTPRAVAALTPRAAAVSTPRTTAVAAAPMKTTVGVTGIIHQSDYDTTLLELNGINVVDSIRINDGTAPPSQTIAAWVELVARRFGFPASLSKSSSSSSSSSAKPVPTSDDKAPKAIAIHCVSGIGRAPTLVALALMEYGMDQYDAVERVRKARRGAFNRTQIRFLTEYKSKSLKELAKRCKGNTGNLVPLPTRAQIQAQARLRNPAGSGMAGTADSSTVGPSSKESSPALSAVSEGSDTRPSTPYVHVTPSPMITSSTNADVDSLALLKTPRNASSSLASVLKHSPSPATTSSQLTDSPAKVKPPSRLKRLFGLS
ncbi:phosphatases II [Ramicandelaber brevisporus]|nr:phosphatases II [Ramicandelaber brevisporus]